MMPGVVTCQAPAVRIRAYEPTDLDAVYDICVRTGADGGDARALVADHRLHGHLWAGPYVTLEPELAFVLDDGAGRAVGYVLAARDAVAFEQRAEREWWPPLRERYPRHPEGTTLDDLLVALLHDRPTADPVIDGPYPSELHIDLLPTAQGRGWGRHLIDSVLEALRGSGSPGVHLGTSARNERAIGFYRHLGFVELTPGRPGAGVLFGRRLG